MEAYVKLKQMQKRVISNSNANDSNIILPCYHLSIVSVSVVKVISYLFLTNPFSDWYLISPYKSCLDHTLRSWE